MIICKKCGAENGESAQFCVGCGSFLDWTGHRIEKEVSSAALAVTPSAILAVPGSEASCEVLVCNTGTIVDEFRIETSGEVADWVQIEPALIRLFPGKEGAAQLTFRPPRSPNVRAGEKRFTVRLHSTVGEDAKPLEQLCSITVAEFKDVAATIAPKTSEALEAGVHTLMVYNRGNAQTEVRLSASDPDDLLVFEFDPGAHIIEPTASAGSRLRVSRRPGVSRPEKQFPFQVQVAPAGSQAVVLDAALVQQRLSASRTGLRWQPWAIAAAALVLLLVSGGMLSIFRAPTPQPPLVASSTPKPGVGHSPSSAPTSAQTASPTAIPTAHSPSPVPPTPTAPPPVGQPGWVGWSTLPSGGTTNAGPAAVTYGNSLFLFGLGIGDHNHYVDIYDGSNWSGWGTIRGGVPSTVGDSAVVYNGKLYLFGINMNNQGHYVNVWDGSTWTGWSQLGGTTLVSDAVAVYAGKLYLFGIGINDHAHWMRVFDGSNWSAWYPVSGGGTTNVSDAATVYNGKLYLFSVAVGNHIVNVYDGSSWSGWNPVPGNGTTNASDSASSYGGKLYLFAIGIRDHGQYVNVFDGSSWSGWSPVPANPATKTSDAAAGFNGKLYLFEIGSTDEHYYMNILSP